MLRVLIQEPQKHQLSPIFLSALNGPLELLVQTSESYLLLASSFPRYNIRFKLPTASILFNAKMRYSSMKLSTCDSFM